VTDHLLSATHFTRLVPGADQQLAVAAGATERGAGLGTSVLCSPRAPVVLAKSSRRSSTCPSTASCWASAWGGTRRSCRGHRRYKVPARQARRRAARHRDPADGGRDVTYTASTSRSTRSRSSAPERRPELWVGGGSQLANEKSPDKPTLVPAVKKRILRGDAGSRGRHARRGQARDWAEIQAALAEQGAIRPRVHRRPRELQCTSSTPPIPPRRAAGSTRPS